MELQPGRESADRRDGERGGPLHHEAAPRYATGRQRVEDHARRRRWSRAMDGEARTGRPAPRRSNRVEAEDRERGPVGQVDRLARAAHDQGRRLVRAEVEPEPLAVRGHAGGGPPAPRTGAQARRRPHRHQQARRRDDAADRSSGPGRGGDRPPRRRPAAAPSGRRPTLRPWRHGPAPLGLAPRGRRERAGATSLPSRVRPAGSRSRPCLAPGPRTPGRSRAGAGRARQPAPHRCPA